MIDAIVGLTPAEVAERRERRLTKTSSRSISSILRANVFTRFNAIISAMFAIVLVFGTGDLVSVDGSVLASHGLELDESLLTGESLPVGKAPGD